MSLALPRHADAAKVLAALPMGTRNYKPVLEALFTLHNHLHSAKPKGVADKTQVERERMLSHFFEELQQHTPYRQVDPRQLGNRHVQAVVQRWVQRGLSTATIHCYLSMLRTFGGWIGKPGLVRGVAYYLGTNAPQVRRCQVATYDHSWTAQGVTIAAKIEEVRLIAPEVALQLELCLRLGLRGKEARPISKIYGFVNFIKNLKASGGNAKPAHSFFGVGLA